MAHEESHYPSDWFRVAEKDLDRVKYLMEAHDSGAAGFFLQQAMEKFLKAFLLSKGWKLERIHDLEALLNAALTYDSSLESYRAVCQKITGFYFFERYPFITEVSLTEDDIRNSLIEVKGLIEKLRKGFVE